MLVYLLAYELRRVWQDLEITIEEGIEEMSCLCATEVKIGNVFIQTIPEPRQMGELLFEGAHVTFLISGQYSPFNKSTTKLFYDFCVWFTKHERNESKDGREAYI